VASDVGRSFASLTPEQLRDRLKGLELPPTVLEQLVVARINSRLDARRRELMAHAIRTAPLWRLSALRNDRLSILTPGQRKELRDLEAEVRDETLRLLGPAPLDRNGSTAFKYGFVPPEKAVLVNALDRDYENLSARLKDDTKNLKLPEDREREKFLTTEQDQDLAAMLTPTERDAYQLRVSPTSQDQAFQSHMRAFQPTEAEYRALFAIQKAEDDRRTAGGSETTRNVVAPTGATMVMTTGRPLLDDAVRPVLSPERFADWQLTNQAHYLGLARIADANGLTTATVKQVASLLSQTADSSWRIAEDATMSGAQKKTAMAELASAARTQVTNQLGASAADTYLKSVRWFDSIGSGTAIMISNNMIAYRPVDPPAERSPTPKR